MVRAPCCEKMGLKKGPWTPEEDHILITYIQQYGHGNWRALPKQAGLLRCGKSCRLRWTNYLRPDIKRGNFSREEEDTIINLHQMLGNRWSAIAARLPGRTDNEIKNVWHTHLKKRLQQQQNHTTNPYPYTKQEAEGPKPKPEPDTVDYGPVSPPQCTTSSDTSSVTTTSMKVDDCAANNLPEVDENFWSEVLSSENCGVVVNDFEAIGADPQEPKVNLEPIIDGFSSDMYDHSMDFWYSVFTRAEDQIPELLEI